MLNKFPDSSRKQFDSNQIKLLDNLLLTILKYSKVLSVFECFECFFLNDSALLYCLCDEIKLYSSERTSVSNVNLTFLLTSR